MKKFLGIFVLALLVTGCSGSKETTTVCKGNAGEVTIESDDSDVNKIIVKTKDDVQEKFGYSGDDDGAKDFIEPMLNVSKMVGINYEVESVKDGIATIVMTIDFSKTDDDSMEQLMEIGYVDSNNKKFSLEKTTELFEKNSGLTCE
ncbi:MAG: lipoprotein [Coprobacillaceae bacterium]